MRSLLAVSLALAVLASCGESGDPTDLAHPGQRSPNAGERPAAAEQVGHEQLRCISYIGE